MLKAILGTLLAFMLSLLSLSARAAIDTATTIAGITDAQTAVLAIIGALLALSVAIFGVVKVYAFVKRKAGA